jgi:hypothetical protein
MPRMRQTPNRTTAGRKSAPAPEAVPQDLPDLPLARRSLHDQIVDEIGQRIVKG